MLTHKEYEDKNIMDVANELNTLAKDLDQKHRMQRKAQFFLDIRGYFIINQIRGSYVEFGIYRGEMTYLAINILDKIQCISHYFGLDTFEGEPELSEEEATINPYLKKSDYAGSYAETLKFLQKFAGEKVTLIKGDFRKDEILNEIDNSMPIALSIIDCNLLSSIKKSIEYSLSRMQLGGVLFIDDFFINMSRGVCVALNILEKEAKNNNIRLIDFNTYAPCAKAFIVTKKWRGATE